MNHEQIMQQERAAVAKAEREATVAYWLLKIYQQHPEIRSCQANDDFIIRHFDGEPTLEGFNHDYEALIGSLATWSDEEKRSWLKKQIRALMPGSPELVGSELRRYDAKAQHTGKYLVTTESMERKLQNLRTGADKGELSVEQLTEEVKSQRTLTGPSAVPSTITKTQLRMMSAAELKRVIKQFGLKAVNARLAEAE